MKKPGRGIGFNYAARGIIYAFKTQVNLRLHLLAAAVALVAAWYFEISKTEVMWVTLAVFLVFITELLNTALETVIDLVNPAYHPLAGTAKDVAAGAVLLAALHALVAGFFVFGGRIL